MKFCENPYIGAELFREDGQIQRDGRADGQTDMMKPRVAFRNFVTLYKNTFVLVVTYI
jgi:hypothetical protein